MPRALASSRCVEIRAEFRGTVIDARQLRPSTRRPGAARWWALVLGLVRGQRDPSRFSLGEGPQASLATPAVDLVTPDAFELVRVSPSGAVGLRFTPSMQGTISVGQRCWSLEEWVRAGRTVADGAALGTTLPPGARCWLQHAEVRVSIEVTSATGAPAPSLEVEWPWVASTAGAFVVLGALLMLAQITAPRSGEVVLEERMAAVRFAGHAPRSMRAPVQPAPTPREASPKPAVHSRPAPALPTPPRADEVVPEVGGARSRGVRRPRASARRAGAAPTPPAGALADAAGLMQRGTSPLDSARTAGVLAMVDTSTLGDSPAAKAFSPDADDREMWEAMASRDVMSKSVAGLSLVGSGRRGGPDAADSLADVASDEVPFEEVPERSLLVKVSRGTARGPMGRDAIRRVVVRHIRDLRRCYDAGVDRRASLRGEVTLTLEIVGRGDVKATTGRFADPLVADCIASAARRWRFVPPAAPRRSRATFEITLRPG